MNKNNILYGAIVGVAAIVSNLLNWPGQLNCTIIGIIIFIMFNFGVIAQQYYMFISNGQKKY